MDIPRKDASKKRLIRRIAIGILAIAAIAGTSVAVSRLKPAAPGVDLSVVWRDSVKRGPMTREARIGTLVPEETMLVPPPPRGGCSDLIRPGTREADSVVMIHGQAGHRLLNAEYALKAAEADSRT
jgi:HlyD family secretion protein